MLVRDLFAAATLLAAALTSSALLSCQPTPAAPDPTATVKPDPDDPASLRQAAAVVSAWNQKDPELTKKVLRENGVVIGAIGAIQAMASASAPVAVASALAPIASATAVASAAAPVAATPRPAQPSRPSAPLA